MSKRVRTLAAEIDASLREAGRPERAAQEQRYLKSSLTHYGVVVPALRKIAKAAFKQPTALSRDELTALAEELWAKPVHERRAVAVELLMLGVARLEAADLVLVERLIRESKTWALVDSLAPFVAGPLFVRFVALGKTLDRWARDDDFWVRRAAMLALLRPLREGGGDFERFGRYADAMLEEKEFFIRKAIGWILREVSKKRPELVHEWLVPRAARASGLTLREASKYLPAAQRAALAKARG